MFDKKDLIILTSLKKKSHCNPFLAMASTNLKQYEKIFLWTYTTVTVAFPFVRFVTIC